MLLREMKPQDAPIISALIDRVYRAFNDALVPPALQHIIEPDQIIEKSRTGYLYLVAEIDGQVAGVITMKDRSHIYHLFIDGPYHGRGIGKALWVHMLERLKEDGPLPKVFTVNSSDFALDFYPKLGFQPTGPKQEMDGIPFTPMAMGEDGGAVME